MEVGLTPGHIVLDGGRSSPSSKRGHNPLQFSAHVCCGQTAGWIKMPLCTMVGLGPGNIVFDADPAPPQGAQPPPKFRPCLCGQTTRWIKVPLGTKVGLGPGHIVLRGDPAPPPPKGGTVPPIFGLCLLWPNGWMDQDATLYDGRPWPGKHCVTCGPSSTPRGAAPSKISAMSVVAKRLIDGSRCHLVRR